MERILLALVAGVLGGGAGALTVDLVRGRPAAPADTSAAAFPAAEWRDFGERLARIETALPSATVPGGATSAGDRMLAGRPGEAPEGAPADAGEAYLQRIEERVAAAAEKAFAKLEEERAEKPVTVPSDKRKRVTLAEAATEIGLSRGEEADLRRIYDETGEKFLKLLAEPGGDVEAVRRDFENAAKNPGGGNVILMKYVPKMLPKIGEVLTIQAEREARIAETLGPERAARYERFDIVEADPYGFGGNFRMEARSR